MGIGPRDRRSFSSTARIWNKATTMPIPFLWTAAGTWCDAIDALYGRAFLRGIVSEGAQGTAGAVRGVLRTGISLRNVFRKQYRRAHPLPARAARGWREIQFAAW